MKLKYLYLILLLVASLFFTISWAYSTQPKVINILMPAPFADSTSDLIKRYNDEHRQNIQIKVTRGPRETEAVSDLAISSLLLGRSSFDLILMDVTWLPKYAAAGWIAPLDSFIEKADWESLALGARIGNSYKGKIYRWPLAADMGLLYWRKDLMKNPPRTPEELIDISLKLQNEGKVNYGYVWQGRQYEGLSCVFLEILNGFGGKWINNSGDVSIGSNQSKEAAKWLRDLIDTGVSPNAVTNFSENESLQIFSSGQAALMRNWPYAWAELQKPSSVVKNKVGVTTMVAKKGYETTSTLGSWGLSILSTSDKKEESYNVISYLTSEDAQKELFEKNGYTPTSTSIFKNEKLIKDFPILNALGNALEVAKPRPQTPLYAQLSDVLQRELSSILTENKNINDSMNKAKEKTSQILLASGEIE